MIGKVCFKRMNQFRSKLIEKRKQRIDNDYFVWEGVTTTFKGFDSMILPSLKLACVWSCVCVCASLCVSLCVSASMWCLCLCVCLWVCGVCVYVCVCEYVVCVFVCLWEHSVCVCVSMCVLSLSVCEREIVCVPVWESVCIYSKPGLSDRRRELQKWVKKDFIEFSFPWEIFTFVIKLLHSPNDMCVCGVCVNVC